MDVLAPGIRRWTAPHPEWRSTVEEVVSYLLTAGEAAVLVDPLLPAPDDVRRPPLLREIDIALEASQRLEILITIPYHTRSAEEVWRRYGTVVATRIWGHANVATRLEARTPLHEIPRRAAGSAITIAGGVARAYTIGKPRRSEHPFYFPALRAVAFGDAVVGTHGGVRFWNQSTTTGEAWYRDVFAPTVRPLLDEPIDHVLVTHGAPVVRVGRRALEECLAAPPGETY
jgi:hypothetical protein